MIKALFLDRDGIINRIVRHPELSDVKGKECKDPLSVDEFIINEHIKEIIEMFESHGFVPVIISNQPGLAKGFFREELLDKINDKIKAALGIKPIYYCPHHPDYTGECSCRKPKDGLVRKAESELGIDVSCSVFIGDKFVDMVAGKRCRKLYLVSNDDKEVSDTKTLDYIGKIEIYDGLKQLYDKVKNDPAALDAC